MAQLIRYKTYSIVTDNKDYDVLQGKHLAACGIAGESEDAMQCAKRLVDSDFNTFMLTEIRKLPASKTKV